MLDDETRMEFADTDQMAFLYQDRVSVLLGTLNDLDYKLDRARYVLTNADGKGCGPTDTGRLDFSHTSASSTRSGQRRRFGTSRQSGRPMGLEKGSKWRLSFMAGAPFWCYLLQYSGNCGKRKALLQKTRRLQSAGGL